MALTWSSPSPSSDTEDTQQRYLHFWRRLQPGGELFSIPNLLKHGIFHGDSATRHFGRSIRHLQVGNKHDHSVFEWMVFPRVVLSCSGEKNFDSNAFLFNFDLGLGGQGYIPPADFRRRTQDYGSLRIMCKEVRKSTISMEGLGRNHNGHLSKIVGTDTQGLDFSDSYFVNYYSVLDYIASTNIILGV
ncbi:hypothetical protein IV203_029890 [Nitzschia inconspicua]|uniref:Uncharacterized protein n=1 Tax=Nitzschia inconspicua TaxID=303405 RepID=A0A9K3LRI9_9STRA|nr:hypothetical protein IV203_029890 [Nitzschia inconspicua]